MKYMSKSIYTKDYRSVIEKLKKARKESGLTQLEVAEKMNKPQSFVSKCESGERRLDITELNKFVKLYKKDINYFLK